MSDSEEEHYVYSDEDDEDGDSVMRDAPASPAREEAPARLADTAYTLLGADDIERMMIERSRGVSELLDVPRETAEVLLRHTGWSSEKLTEAYWTDGEALQAAAGVADWTADDGAVKLPAAGRKKKTCEICFDDVPASQARAAPCGHFFCADCYRGYLATAVASGPGSVMTTCPDAGCQAAVPLALWEELLDEAQLARHRRFRAENFVGFARDLRWCPGANCGKCVRAGAAITSVKCAPNGCGYAFCVRCGEESHQPVSCKALATWVEKCQNESETANWILANTKRCPKCQCRIEKNQGCNHMQCQQCKYDFCWMCLGPWGDHGGTTGGYYKCNKYDPTKDADDDGDAAKAKRELDRYLHYYKRYHGHHQAQQFATKQLEATEKRMVEFQEQSKGSWIDVQFLKAANEMVIDCRRVLKATYIFGYTLDPEKQRAAARVSPRRAAGDLVLRLLRLGFQRVEAESRAFGSLPRP